MTEELGPRKLAAIMSIDVAGYSAMSEVDETKRSRSWRVCARPSTPSC
ncbi:MAG: hypothetical protein IPL62_12015 [Caulobacteraceae bacterium]|nr:hypothetical protein [Caulobacteraceae bacterium]